MGEPREARTHWVFFLLGATFLGAVLVRFYAGAVTEQYSLKNLEAPPIDLNRAEFWQLLELPGVEESLAQRILGEREHGGPFRDGEDLCRRVRGIGEQTLKGMLEHAVIDSAGGQ